MYKIEYKKLDKGFIFQIIYIYIYMLKYVIK